MSELESNLEKLVEENFPQGLKATSSLRGVQASFPSGHFEKGCQVELQTIKEKMGKLRSLLELLGRPRQT